MGSILEKKKSWKIVDKGICRHSSNVSVIQTSEEDVGFKEGFWHFETV